MLLILELDIDLSRLVEGNTLVDVDALDDPTLRHALLHELVDTVDPIDLTQRDHKSEGQVSGTGTVSALGAAEADGAVDGYTASTISSAGCGPSRAGRPCRPSRSWVVMGRPSRSSPFPGTRPLADTDSRAAAVPSLDPPAPTIPT